MKKKQTLTENPSNMERHLEMILALLPGETYYEKHNSLLRLQIEHASLAAKCDKVATWLEKGAEHDARQADACWQFESLKKAYLDDAKNKRTTAKDIRSVIPVLKP